MKKIGLLFSGQGAQYVGMGKDLTENYPAAKALFDKADALLKNNFSKVCFEGPAEELTKTNYCQPALYTQGLALLEILKQERPGFEFVAAAGLSLGEFTAHAAAGSFTFEEGLKLVAERGRLMQEACESTKGSMATILGADAEACEKLAAAAGVGVANYNCPGQIVLSGSVEGIDKAIELSKDMGFKKVIKLNVAGAYHSSLMDSARQGLKKHLDAANIQSPKVTVLSNVTGDIVSTPDQIRDTLERQVTGSVRWESCIRKMASLGVEELIELGPGKVLAGLCKRTELNIPCISIGNLEDVKSQLLQPTA
jgi:[acyl-carrier-protein] S-malonyltransferase